MPKTSKLNPPKISREITRRLLRREKTAAYLDISARHLDLLRERGAIPLPKQLSEAVFARDIADLDRYIDSLPYAGRAIEAPSVDAKAETSRADAI